MPKYLFLSQITQPPYEVECYKYNDRIDKVFKYKMYRKDDFDIMHIHFDYVKQHVSVAFPSKILLENIPQNIKYEINSKYCPDVIMGNIEIGQ